LFLVILIPLLITYFIASYGYNSDKFGQGRWKDEYEEEYLAFLEEKTTEEKLKSYMKYGINTQYYLYNETPIHKEVVQHENEDLFTLAIYQTLYNSEVEDQEINRVQYLFLIYDVQYQNIRDSFPADVTLRQEINKANVPTFVIDLTEVLPEDAEESPLTKSVIITSISLIKDEGADFDTVKGEVLEDDEETTSTLLSVVLGTANIDNLEWATKTKIEVSATISGIKDDKGNDIKQVLKTFEKELAVEKEDTEGFVASYQRDLTSTGYFSWAFKNYLWWISLITFVASGLITFSFYGVYLAEIQETQKKKKTGTKAKR
jgi:putative lipase involved disintegration of autophagic bodies